MSNVTEESMDAFETVLAYHPSQLRQCPVLDDAGDHVVGIALEIDIRRIDFLEYPEELLRDPHAPSSPPRATAAQSAAVRLGR
jgi:hypothetical protein